VHYDIVGNKWFCYATFSSVPVDADDWTPALNTVDAAFITNGDNNVNDGITYSGKQIIFQCAGAMANVKILVIGT
jgi:hypothetical protein